MRPIAFYLPQYHPIAENDRWWGKGFTEWANVTRARPLFKGHDQPHLPADLGFYDLRLPEARQAQADLAREYGISGFCYYHYWLHGHRLLERPFSEVLQSGQPDFPFCLCWANETWSRRWDGEEAQILLEQTYSEADDLAHFQALLPAFRDPRYLRVKGRPLFLIYRTSRLPDAAKTISRWRSEAQRVGLPGLYLCNVESMAPEHGLAPRLGLDAAVEFAPDWTCLPRPLRRRLWHRLASRLRLTNRVWVRHKVLEYHELASKMLTKPAPAYLRYPGVTPMWDNSARRKEGAIIFRGLDPEIYQQWLTAVLSRFNPPSGDEDLVFINAWNEWAEGNHLEPCQRWGRAYLDATKTALNRAQRASRSSAVCAG